MADEVKLITFAGETVSPLYDGLMQELYTGGGGIITGAVVTIKDASNLHITGGYGALCGREFEIFASDIPVTLSSSGTLKGRLYLHMDLAQSGAPIELLVEVAASLTPVVQDSDVNTTNGVYEVNLATFDVGTSAISNLVDVSPKLSKIPDQISSLNSALTPQYGTFTVESSNYTASYLLVMKQGKLCYFNVFVQNSGTWASQSSWQYLGTISEGFRPSVSVRVMADDNTHDVAIVVNIATNGRVSMMVTSASSGMKNIVISAGYAVS